MLVLDDSQLGAQGHRLEPPQKASTSSSGGQIGNVTGTRGKPVREEQPCPLAVAERGLVILFLRHFCK